MTEIKFRAWIHDAPQRRRKEAMFYQNNQYLSSFINRIYSKYLCNHPSQMPFQLEERLMQYTGLKDYNGKEIYKGDILKHPNSDEKFVVKWVDHYCGFRAVYNNFDLSLSNQVNEKGRATIIGNIFQNPELLEVEE